MSGPVDGSISVLRKKECAPSAAPREVWRHAPPRKFSFLRSFLLHSGVKNSYEHRTYNVPAHTLRTCASTLLLIRASALILILVATQV